MNEKNLEYLKKLLFHLGFGDKLNPVLESAISRGKQKFSIGLSNSVRPLEIGQRDGTDRNVVNYQLNFSKHKEHDTFYLNDYQVTLHNKHNLVPRTQLFDLERDHRITAMQAYKLLSGYSFEKDVYLRDPNDRNADAQKIPMWFRLNLDVTDAYGNHPLKTMRPEYGYDLAASLSKYPLQFNEAPVADVIRQLSSGNVAKVNLVVDNNSLPVSIAANPQMKTIDIYDSQARVVRDSDIWPDKSVAQTTVVHQQASDELSAGQEFSVDEPGESRGKQLRSGR